MAKSKIRNNSAILLICCPDQQGIVATVTRFISEHSGNIIHLDQHVDVEQDVFFMRIEWELDGFDIKPDDIKEVFRPIAEQFQMDVQLRFTTFTKKMAVFVSKQGHCFYDILSRVRSGEWHVELPIVVSNHRDLEDVVKLMGMEFHHFKMTKDNKAEQEAEQLALLKDRGIDLVVLARYMQILSDDFVSHYPNRIINVHHAFLPAFPGAKPYHQAHLRGVKLIGATSHYVTADLDAGPIIAQDVIRVTHKDSISDMIRKGQDTEKSVLSHAVWNHLQDKIAVYNNKTVIFE
ncbi:MAG: formyltetrahydrofolate deformylase [Verrucomicrobia bacterium]|nr:formyltetrahydrofolate deformylase [Verrucomicrobiota bacterium]